MGTLLAQKVDEAESSVVVELSTNPKTLNHTKESNDTEFNQPARGENFQQSFTLEPFSENYTVITMQNYDFGYCFLARFFQTTQILVLLSVRHLTHVYPNFSSSFKKT